jgi:two-component system, OmpR family, sensor histidine kinase MprB
MTISRRLSMAAAVAVAVAIALASIGAYFAVRAKLRGEVDSSLRERATAVQAFAPNGTGPQGPSPAPFSLRVPAPPPDVTKFGGAAGVVQFVGPSGQAEAPPGMAGASLPVTGLTRAIAAGDGGTTLQDETVDGDHLRVITAPLTGGGAVQVARPLDEVDSTLHGLILLLAVITAGGVGLAALLGHFVSRTSLAPIRRFTARTEEIATGPELVGRRLPVEGDDELGRLARSYNTTLEALERSVAAQRQLVSDASHELRTPLASLKANLEVLLRKDQLAAGDRRDLTRDLTEQADELTLLVEDVVELARNGQPEPQAEDVRLDEVVAEAVQRARRHAPGIRFDVELDGPTVVNGEPERLGRAVRNLLDNAAKWSPTQGTVEVRLRDGRLGVRDHGPGIDPGDLPHVFERFYRASGSRGRPGSGLGLAIVRQIADAHGATVSAVNAPGGGALVRVWFPHTNGHPPAGG